MPKAVGSPQITLRYRPTDPLGELLSSLPQGADKTKAVNEALRFMREALEPFAAIKSAYVEHSGTRDDWAIGPSIKVGDVRRAQRAMAIIRAKGEQ